MRTPTYLTGIAIAGTVAFFASPVFAAGEIWYATFAETAGNEVGLIYKGPAGTKEVVCTISGDCESGTVAKLPAIAGATLYPASPDRKYGVKTTLLGSVPYHILYEIGSGKAVKRELIPYKMPGAAVKWSGDSSTVLFVGPGSTMTTYNVQTKKLTTATIGAGGRAFETISPNGKYLAGYNYLAKAHTIWRLSDGVSFIVSDTAPSYLEFSDDGQWVAYAKTVNQYKTLYAAKLGTSGISDVRQVTNGKGVIEDYIFAGNALFHMSNTEYPLTFNLFAYTPGTNANSKIASDVSYGDYLKRVSGNVVYLKVEGATSNAYAYDPKTKKTAALKGVSSSAVENGITRETIKIANKYAVVLSPKEDAGDTLFVWLHGGPERQTSLTYHSYLSYAVYDELLEKLAASGNYVLKLDYTGSSGYGEGVLTALHQKVGVADVADVAAATAEFKKTHKSVKRVVLIGNSYGGYLSLKSIVAKPSNFDGAISINGVADWYALIERIPSSVFTPLFNGVPDIHNMPSYLAASVYTDLPKLDDDQKILIVYGTDDSTVPTWQSTDYLKYAKAKNINVDSLVLSGEEHVIRKRASLNKLCEQIEESFEVDGLSCGVSKSRK